MERSEAIALYRQGEGAVVDALVALTRRVEELERRLSSNSRTSSKPPSSDPPWKKKRRKRDKPGKPGAKEGHEGHHRKPLAADRVDEFVPVWSASCGRCGHVLPHAGVPVGVPTVHQVAEVPPVAVRVTEYRLQRVCCPACAHVTLADLPEGVTASAFGPRLHALVPTLTAQLRGSRRNVADVLVGVFGMPVSIGGVDAMLATINEPMLIDRGFKAGAAGFVCKESSLETLCDAIDVVMTGKQYVDPALATALVDPERVNLTPREFDVLELLGEGLQNDAIALRLGLSQDTVKEYVSTVIAKLDATSRTQAIANAFRRSLLG